ncbi:MAG: histidine phosphotransferase family protein [Rhodospirillales bacterium]
MDELKLAELLCSRLCHDLVSPVGAVNNGIELMEEFGGDSAEAMALIASSGRQAARRLQFYRVAFGQAGTQIAQPIADVRELLDGIFEGGKLSLKWDPTDAAAPAIVGWGKLLCNLVSLAAESLPRGGTLTVAVAAAPDRARLEVAAGGQGCRLVDELRQALDPAATIEGLSPRGVQPFFTARLAERMGGKLEVAGPDADRMTFAATIPVRD